MTELFIRCLRIWKMKPKMKISYLRVVNFRSDAIINCWKQTFLNTNARNPIKLKHIVAVNVRHKFIFQQSLNFFPTHISHDIISLSFEHLNTAIKSNLMIRVKIKWSRLMKYTLLSLTLLSNYDKSDKTTISAKRI